ncbi:MAG: hypothetical protein DWQ08_07615 [Proteobacteria bacterium]|nr:MAG: hypothetical protein DWQ08_07615 [Pseudomonadota bacterium]
MGKPKKRWTASYAGGVLDKADRAKSDRAYAARRGINAQRLAWWRKQLKRPRGGRAASCETTFIEVRSKPVASATSVDVLLTNGRHLRFSDQIDPAVAGRLADALESRC